MSKNRIRTPWVILGIATLLAAPAVSADEEALSKGQTLYVPAYSHVMHGDRNQPFQLTATLCVRNADPAKPITLLTADYHDSKGEKIRGYIEQPKVLPPLASTEFVVKESDKGGGVGASFVVRWNAETVVVAPVVETILIGTAASQGISFVGQSRVIDELGN